ncbi:hypothetical protein F5B20DRAFT_589372, partial [Whalleya microplaca]
ETNNEHLATKCYGYLRFDKETHPNLCQELTLRKMDFMSDIYWLPGPENEEYDPGKDVFPIYALVKELRDRDTGYLKSKDVGRMGRHLKQLHRVGIVCRDLEGNYLEGKINDLSSAWTVPHRFLDETSGLVSSDIIEGLTFQDYVELELMIEDHNRWHKHTLEEPHVWYRVFPDRDYLCRLRRTEAELPSPTKYVKF